LFGKILLREFGRIPPPKPRNGIASIIRRASEMAQAKAIDPDEYVRNNRDTLVRIIKHGNDDFVRSLALAALVEFGEDPDIEKVRRELEKAAELDPSG
jgi:hypothetical protein